MNGLTISQDPIATALEQHAISPAQAALVTGPLAECACAVCIGVAILETAPDDEAMATALQRMHAWSTTAGPMQ